MAIEKLHLTCGRSIIGPPEECKWCARSALKQIREAAKLARASRVAARKQRKSLESRKHGDKLLV